MTKRRNGPTSERVRQAYNWTWFKSLSIGEKYVWASDLDGYTVKTGVCEKISTRKFRYKDKDGKDVEGKVGSVEAIAVKLDKDGNPHKTGDYTPYLGD